eukprot:1565604-Amphidinium_carterae.1
MQQRERPSKEAMTEVESDGLTAEAYLTCALPGIVVAAVMYMIFLCMRPRYPDTFAPRAKQAVAELECTSPVLSQGLLDWFQPFWKLSIEETSQNVSIDAAARLIFQLTLLKIFGIASILVCVAMLPVYLTADGEETAFSKLTMANIIEVKSTRYWGVAIMAWPVSLIVYYFIYVALKEVLKLKVAAERRVNPWSHLTVLVQNIPEKSRTSDVLEKHLQEKFGDEVGLVQPVKAMGK